jgi:hypothetical protein
MATGNKNIAICRNCHPGRPIEGTCTTSARTHLAEHHQHLAVLAIFESLPSEDDARGIAHRHAEYGLFVVHIADPQIALVVDRAAESSNQSL